MFLSEWREYPSAPCLGIQSPDRPARSESLYRLCYPGPRPCIGEYSAHVGGPQERG